MVAHTAVVAWVTILLMSPPRAKKEGAKFEKVEKERKRKRKNRGKKDAEKSQLRKGGTSTSNNTPSDDLKHRGVSDFALLHATADYSRLRALGWFQSRGTANASHANV